MATDEGWEGGSGAAWTGVLGSSRGSDGEVSGELTVKDLGCCAGEPELYPSFVLTESPKQSNNMVRCVY